MSEKKHTDGPWRSDYPVIYAASGAKLITVDEYDCATIYDTPLMAAAPELLAALKMCLDMICDECADGKYTVTAERAQAAINKATGCAS